MVALPNATPPKRTATYADIESAPPNMTAEIIAGSLVLSPRPARPHATTFSSALVDIGGAFGKRGTGNGGWVILGEPELHVDGILPDVFVPDIAGWKRERFPDDFMGHKFAVAPDWVCEISSKSTRARDQVLKSPLYARAGIQWMWLIEPIDCRIDVFENNQGRWSFVSEHIGHVRARIQPFDAVEIDLGEWWSTPPSDAAAEP